jgi:hypothetical protein
MNELVKYSLFALGGAIATVIILKAIKKKVESKPSQTTENFKKVAKTDEFKTLIQTDQFKKLIKTPQFKKFATDFGLETLVSFTGI